MRNAEVLADLVRALVLGGAIVAMTGGVAMGAPTSRPASLGTAWGDLGDGGGGTYANPVLPGDYSDLDAIKVGEDYYAISSTMQFSPGMVVLTSKDLVSWKIAGHAIEDVTQISPEMNWDRMGRYGRGVWAGAIRHREGKFWVYFGDPDEGFFMTTATDAAGPWAPLTRVTTEKGWDDCCPFWDDDGQGYFVCTNFSDGYKITLFKMTADGKSLVSDSGKVLYSSKGSEANKLYKINGMYYHYFSEVKSEGRVPMMRRAKSLDGPWETKQIGHVSKNIDHEPNQGGLIEVRPGEWWFVTHQGSGTWEGRTMSLLPVNWVDGWPNVGQVGSDGIGNMVWQAKKPVTGFPATRPQTDDDFDGARLGVQWEWNYQPRAEKWSLTERPGFLRLHSFKPLKGEDLTTVGNMLTQRSMNTAANEVTIKLDVSGMKDGDEAGLSHFARANNWTLGVSQTGEVRKIVFRAKGKPMEGPVLAGKEIYLRSTWPYGGLAQFSYSLDGKTFTEFGAKHQLAWQSYRGDRTGIFHYNRAGEGGFIDVDWYRYAMAGPGSGGEAK